MKGYTSVQCAIPSALFKFENLKKNREKHILNNDLSMCHSWAANLSLTFINQTKKENVDKRITGLPR